MLLYASTIALSAFLLFLVQPVVAKQILPWFGGSAAVWTTCMVFFQLVLLAGYAYSDFVIRRLAARRQALLHTVLLLASLAFLPIVPGEAFRPQDADNPIGRILLLLAATIGLPYLMLSTTGPLVQAWFARRYSGGQVYRLYALSNVASMLALVLYPPVIEPMASSRLQSLGWSVAYALFVALAIAAAWVAARARAGLPAVPVAAGEDAGAAAIDSAGRGAPSTAAGIATPAHAGHVPAPREQALWLLLSAMGSVLLLAVTTHITQNVASIPFLWVLPLAIYLTTFILCFDGKGWYLRPWYATLTSVLLVLMLAGLSWTVDWDKMTVGRGIVPIDEAVPLYAFGLFVLCMFCHGELVARKPEPAHLTRFYLMVSLGGAVGGLFVGIVAPLAFDWYWEFPLALTVLALLAIFVTSGAQQLLAAAAFCVALVGLADYNRFVRTDTIELGRNFYGALRVKATAPDTEESARWRLLHGVITHGEQFRAPQFRALATTYYGGNSGVARAIEGLRARAPDQPQRVGLIGLGVGTLATYGRTGDTYRTYELNPEVLDVAKRRFSFLGDSKAKIETPLGDARLVLEREPPQRFDVLAVDAFSSDSIPVHLITREAALLYQRHVAPGGVIAFHISNRYLALAGVVRQLADDIGWQAVRVIDEPREKSFLYRSDWVLVTANAALVEQLEREGVGEAIEPRTGTRPWTDDYNNLFQVLK
jgi:hypothetical protein